MRPGADDKLEPSAKDKGLGELVSWPVSIGYFEAKGGDLTPSYQIDFRLYANGVSRELLIDYGDFSIHGTLTSLEYLKRLGVPYPRDRAIARRPRLGLAGLKENRQFPPFLAISEAFG